MTGLDPTAQIPVWVLTGFLGSGKTTVLNKLLCDPQMADSAILINEFGEIGLDHLFVQDITENLVQLNSGCLCCSVRGDLVEALRMLFIQRLRGDVPAFGRVVIETTGLADPAPIVHTLITDVNLSERYWLNGIVTTMDATMAHDQLERHEEARRQVAMADRILVSKLDLVEGPIDGTMQLLRSINPAADIIKVGDQVLSDVFSLPDDGKPTVSELERWFDATVDHEHAHASHDHDGHGHNHVFESFCIVNGDPIDWERLMAWLADILPTHGPSILRMKGIIYLQGAEKPVMIHGVQHIFYPAVPLTGSVPERRVSQIVLIGTDMDEPALRASFDAHVHGGN